LPHIRELHLMNVKRKELRIFVARKLLDGEIDVLYCTLEILGEAVVFEHQFLLVQEWLRIVQNK